MDGHYFTDILVHSRVYVFVQVEETGTNIFPETPVGIINFQLHHVSRQQKYLATYIDVKQIVD